MQKCIVIVSELVTQWASWYDCANLLYHEVFEDFEGSYWSFDDFEGSQCVECFEYQKCSRRELKPRDPFKNYKKEILCLFKNMEFNWFFCKFIKEFIIYYNLALSCFSCILWDVFNETLADERFLFSKTGQLFRWWEREATEAPYSEQQQYTFHERAPLRQQQ